MYKKLKFLLGSFLLLGVYFQAEAQQLQVPLDQNYLNKIDRYLNRSGVGFHSSIKPYLESEVMEYIPAEKLAEMGMTAYNPYFSGASDSTIAADSLAYKEGFSLGLRRGDFVQFQKKKVYIGINPLIDLGGGYDVSASSKVFSAGYGAQLNASFGKMFSAGFAYRGVSEQPLDYVSEIADSFQVLPGFSKLKRSGDALLSNDINAYVSFTPAKYFNAQVGYGRHFWGDGYRSLFLSDYAPSYPYVALNTNFWRVKYTFLFNMMKDGQRNLTSGDYDFNKKYGVYHMLSVDVSKSFQFGFFEGVVWEDGDSTGKRGIDINYLNPVVFFRPVEFALGSPDNVVLGINLKFKIQDRANFYAQFLLDDLDIKKARAGKGFYRNKFAFQAGVKTYDIFNIPNLDVQGEFNLVRPFVYAHKTPQQNYTHMNMPLAHPLGANFMEAVVIVRYQKESFYGRLKLQYAKQGRDDVGDHFGSNIFVSDFLIAPNLDQAYNNEFLQGVATKIFNAEARGGYLLNPRIGLAVEAIANYRTLSSSIANAKNFYIGLGLRTSIFNRYTDF